MEPRVLTDSFSRLADVYRYVETGSEPRCSPADVARWVFPQVCGGESAELTRIGVTVVGKIASCLTARSSLLPPEVAFYFTELLKVLFDDLDLMSHLVSDLLHGTAKTCGVSNVLHVLDVLHVLYQVSHFEAVDQILSHLAAKSASARVLHLLHQSVRAPAAQSAKRHILWHFVEYLRDSYLLVTLVFSSALHANI